MKAGEPVSVASHRASFGEAVRWWEWRRIPYNLLMAAVVAYAVARTWPHFRPALRGSSLPPLAGLALIANALYCAAYVVEALVDPDARPGWRRRRWMLWTAGTLLALLIELYWIGDEIYPAFP